MKFTLLKEYIALVVKESLSEDIVEDIDPARLSPTMVGIYAFAQAINKLIYEGNALPGAVPIDIIDAGRGVNKAPMATDVEKRAGISFQYNGNSFKLYLDPTINYTELDGGNETHDIIHAFTANIGKAFARRRESISKADNYSISPSRFNKIKIDKKLMKKVQDQFQKDFGIPIPDEVFNKVFEFKSDSRGYYQWAIDKLTSQVKEEDVELLTVRTTNAIRNIVRTIYYSIWGEDFGPGQLGRRYYANKEQPKSGPDLKLYGNDELIPYGYDFGFNKTKNVYNQSIEDEEEIGNKMNDIIGKAIANGNPIEDPKGVIDTIIRKYIHSAGISGIPVAEFKHRFDTPEFRNALERLLAIYNNLLRRYMVAARNHQDPSDYSYYDPSIVGSKTKQVNASELSAAKQKLGR